MAKAKKEKSGRIVLVGTYKGDQLTKWRGWYNYPIENVKCKVENVKCGESDFQRINELWLFNGTKDERRYKAEFVGVKTREELIRDYGYLEWENSRRDAESLREDSTRSTLSTRLNNGAKPHGTHYALFKTTLLYRHKGEVPADAECVIVRTKDFARSPKVRKQLKAYLESHDRNDPDLAKRLPEIITRLRPDQLRVCEAAVHIDLLQWESAVGMSPLLGKIESIVMSIGEFGRAYSLSSSDAYLYLKKYKGLAYLEDCHEPLSCLPMESLVDDLAQVCRNNGGKLK